MTTWLSERVYKSIYSRVPRVCVDLVIKDRRGIMLSWRDIEPAKNTWHFPGGRILFKETVKQALMRVAKEEVGIKIRPIKLLGFMEFPNELQYGQPRHSVSLVFLVEPKSAAFRGGWQAKKLQFFKKMPAGVYKIHKQFLKQNHLL